MQLHSYADLLRGRRAGACDRGGAANVGRFGASCNSTRRSDRRLRATVARPGGSGGQPIDSAAQLRAQLKHLGLADPAIEAAWPRWWSDDAEASPSAQAELRFGVARRLGLDPGSLLADDEPRFLWREEARFKRLASENDVEQAGIASFGRAVASALASVATPSQVDLSGWTAQDLRGRLLKAGRPYVALEDLVVLSWSFGIPVVHLRIFPWAQKRMAAMTVRVGKQSFVLLAKDALYPAWIAFYLAHELAHIALGLVDVDQALVDLETEERETEERGATADDDEEQAADAWALELLTGMPSPTVTSADGTASARELARVALASAPELGIEPGTLALCFGYSTGQWGVANGAISAIYDQPAPVWQAINAFAATQLGVTEPSPDALDFLDDVLELPSVR